MLHKHICTVICSKGLKIKEYLNYRRESQKQKKNTERKTNFAQMTRIKPK